MTTIPYDKNHMESLERRQRKKKINYEEQSIRPIVKKHSSFLDPETKRQKLVEKEIRALLRAENKSWQRYRHSTVQFSIYSHTIPYALYPIYPIYPIPYNLHPIPYTLLMVLCIPPPLLTPPIPPPPRRPAANDE